MLPRDPNTQELLRRLATLLDRLEGNATSPPLPSEQAPPVPPQPLTMVNVAAPKKVQDVVEDFLEAKRADGLSVRYIETIRGHLRRFAAEFRCEIDSVNVAQMESWLRNQPIGARARNNIRASIVTLFHFARTRRYLAKGQPTEADEIAKAKDIGGKIGILQPEELARILAHAQNKVALFIAFGAFTGMRSSEILRLEWNDVNFDRQFITIAAHKAKTATRRIVPIHPNLMCWIAQHRENEGSPFHTRRDASHAILYAKACGVEWPNNALRHSYATYRLAGTGNAARVAFEMGSSPQKLITNYRELVDPQLAERWFSIIPDPPARSDPKT